MAKAKQQEDRPDGPRKWFALAFTGAEDIIYIGLGILLAATGLAFLVTEMVQFWASLAEGKFSGSMCLCSIGSY